LKWRKTNTPCTRLSVIVASLFLRVYRRVFNLSMDKPEQCQRNRRHHRSSSKVLSSKALNIEAAGMEETEGLVEHQDAPPVYEEHELPK
jgi:CRISPR/Cas system CMR subunit Cmr6 (Cas7 group RAMP superfamily)